jgi:hypothetical protein
MKSDLNFSFRFLFFGAFVALFSTCSEGERTTASLSDAEYLPLSLGTYQIYDVTETEYVNGPIGATVQYELRTKVVDSFPGTGGHYSYIIYRETRTAPTEQWDYLDTWTATVNSREVMVQEGNTSFVKLDLPIRTGSRWNGNLYNNLGEEAYSISSFRQPATVNQLVFDDAVEVTQKDEVDDIIGNDVRKETYARGVGLINKKTETVVYCSNTPECLGEKIIQEGYVWEQTIKEYGNY